MDQMTTQPELKIEKWNVGAYRDIEYKGALSLSRLYFFFSADGGSLLMELPRETTFRVIEESHYTARFLAINSSKNEQGIRRGTTLKIWNAPLPQECSYVILGEDICVEIVGVEPTITALANSSFTNAMQQILEKERRSFNDSGISAWFDNKIVGIGKLSAESKIRAKPWHLELPARAFAYAGLMDFFDLTSFFFTNRQSSFAVSVPSYTSFAVGNRKVGPRIGDAIEDIRMRHNLASSQSWMVWDAPFTRMLDADGLLYLNVPDEARNEKVILTPTHEVEFLGNAPKVEVCDGTSVEILMLSKFEEAKTRELAFLTGTSIP